MNSMKVRKSTASLYADMTADEKSEYCKKAKHGVDYWKKAAELAFKDAMTNAEHGSNMNGKIGHRCKRNLWTCIRYYQSNYIMMKEIVELDRIEAEKKCGNPTKRH